MRGASNELIVVALIIMFIGWLIVRLAHTERLRLVISATCATPRCNISTLDNLYDGLLFLGVDNSLSLQHGNCFLDLCQLPHLCVPFIVHLGEIQFPVVFKRRDPVFAFFDTGSQVNNRLFNILKRFLKLFGGAGASIAALLASVPRLIRLLGFFYFVVLGLLRWVIFAVLLKLHREMLCDGSVEVPSPIRIGRLDVLCLLGDDDARYFALPIPISLEL